MKDREVHGESNMWNTAQRSEWVKMRKKLTVLIKKQQPYIQNMKAIHGELQHSLVVAHIDKKKIRNVVRKTY